MIRNVFKERKAYTKDDLNCFGDRQLTELMETGVLRRLSDREFRFEFIGAIAVERMVAYVVPAFEVTANIDSGLTYVRIIQRYLSETTRSATNPRLDSIPLVMQTFSELNSFFSKFGLYQERKTIEVNNSKSPISWGKTVNRGDVVLARIPTDGLDEEIASAFYPSPVRQRVSAVRGELGDLFRKLLTILASFIAPIMRLRHPLEIHAKYDQISDWLVTIVGRADYYRRLLRRAIPLESGSRRRVLKVIFDFLSDEHKDSLRNLNGTVFTFGVDRFDRIWEDACIKTLGAERGSKQLAQPVISGSLIPIKIGRQQLDGLVKFPETKRAVIIDAKNYPVRNGVPTKDIMKQFGYYVSAESLRSDFTLANALIFPGDAQQEDLRLVGTVRLEIDDLCVSSAGDILLFEANPPKILRPYLERRACSKLQALLHDKVFSDGQQLLDDVVSAPAVPDLVDDRKDTFVPGQRLMVSCGNQSLDLTVVEDGCVVLAGAEMISPTIPKIGPTRWIGRKGYSAEKIASAMEFVERLKLATHSTRGPIFVLHDLAPLK